MHTVGLHSALAIKRQRKRRDEQRRARDRRYSSQSGESGLTSPRLSTASFEHRQHKSRIKRSQQGVLDTKSVTSIGMLHVGVVFLVLGVFLLISGILPSYSSSSKNKSSRKWWNELVAIGLFSTAVGCFLIVLNRIIAQKEDDDLEKYIKRQLTRSKSGHRLERDIETGELTTKHHKKIKQNKKSNLSSPIDNKYDREEIFKSSQKISSTNYITHSINEIYTSKKSPTFLDEIAEEQSKSDKLESLTDTETNTESAYEKKSVSKCDFSKNKSCRSLIHGSICVEGLEM